MNCLDSSQTGGQSPKYAHVYSIKYLYTHVHTVFAFLSIEILSFHKCKIGQPVAQAKKVAQAFKK